MKNDLTCGVVNDLLPSYVEGLTTEETNQAVKTHLEHCKSCTDTLHRMQQPEDLEQSKDIKTIDFLKKTRKKTRMHLLIGILITVILVVVAVVINAFFVGQTVKDPDLIKAQVTVTDRHIALIGNLTDSGKGVSDVKFENHDGVIKVTFMETLKSKYHSNDFYSGYNSESIITQIWIGDRIIWDHGDEITPEVAKLFDTKHPYIGEMPANGKTATALGIWKDIGNFTNELQTKEAPYGWKLIGEQDYAVESQNKIENQMRSYASALIATIDNLGYVTYEYTVNGDECSLTVTEEDANELAGQSVKEMGKTPCGLQQLMKILNLSEGYLGSRLNDYKQNEDGTWSCNDITYKYRVVLTGRLPNAAIDSRYVVLTNNMNITFHDAWWSMFSSNSADWLDPKESVIVEIGGN